VLRSEDEESFRLKIGLAAAYRASVTFNPSAQVRNPFFALRPSLSGNIYKKWITFYTQLELVGNPPFLLDSLVQVQPWDELGIVFGQQYTPYSRHEYLYGPTQLFFTDWDIVADYFWTGRDKGATLQGAFADHLIEYWAGAYLGMPLRQFDTIKGNYVFIARLAVNPQGTTGNTEFAYAENADKDEPAKLATSFAIQGYSSKVIPGTQNFNPQTFKFVTTPGTTAVLNSGVAADAYLQSSSVMAQAEGYFRRTTPHEGLADYSSVGAWAHVGVLVYKRALDVGIRGSWANVNVTNDGAKGVFLAGEVISTWYIHTPNLALKLRYGYADQQGPADGSSSIGGAPLILSPGNVHVLTSQFNLTF
jgi:hypothetical protein